MATDAVRVENVTKVYRSGDITVRALDGVSFALKRGEFAAIVGPSGSGKSTLMNILGTIDRPTNGQVYIDGALTTDMTNNQLADFRNKRLGFVFQAFNLINGFTAEQNVMLPLMMQPLSESERRERAVRMLEQLGLGGRLHMLPTKLSGGEQQRVAIARALVNNPSIILADEPTGDLDTKSGENVVKLLKRICVEQKVTIIMVTHNLDITEYCDQIIRIRDGKKESDTKVRAKTHAKV